MRIVPEIKANDSKDNPISRNHKNPNFVRTDEDGDKAGVMIDAREDNSWTGMIQGIARKASVHEKGEVFRMREGDNLPRIVTAIREAIEFGTPGLLKRESHWLEQNVLRVMDNIERRNSFKRQAAQQGLDGGENLKNAVA